MKSRSLTQSQSGFLVETKDGKRGATYHSKGLINGKVPVYLEIDEPNFSNKAILCSPETLKKIGFID